MKKRLPKRIFSFLKEVGDLASESRNSTYLVGGFVRDLILGYENLDLDLVVEGDGVDFAKQIALKFGGHMLVHDRFGTVALTLPGGFKVDFATSRREVYPHAGSLPLVEKGSIKEDLYRRDFTINAISVKLNAEVFGELFDPFDGVCDLENKTLRVMHDLSFTEDPTRILRGIRFEKRYELNFEERTKTLMESALDSEAIANISGQRLRNELLSSLKEPKSTTTLERLWEAGILKYVHQSLTWSNEIRVVMSEVDKWSLWWQGKLPRHRIDLASARLMALFKALDAGQIRQVCKRLGFDNKTLKLLLESKSALESAPTLSKPISHSQIYDLLNSKSNETILFLLAAFKDKIARENISDYLFKIRGLKPLVDGKILKRLGYPPGPIYSQVLQETFKAQLDGKFSTEPEAVSFVKKRFPVGAKPLSLVST